VLIHEIVQVLRISSEPIKLTILESRALPRYPKRCRNNTYHYSKQDGREKGICPSQFHVAF